MTAGQPQQQQVLYRKWRPQRFEDVAGQDPIVQTLRNALERGRVGHAYLFCGPRGTGKTTTARILAKALNCETSGGRGGPCGECGPCREIAAGSHIDLFEVDAATNRGIDEVRDLREKVDFVPAAGRAKVYIIDEVHMMTNPAFNALLKTLEEPPAHAYFILATTEPHRVPLTIASRCQRFDFRRIAGEDAAANLRKIADAEGFHIDPDALDAVVRASNGSLRDASNLLEQVVLTAGANATIEDAREMLGLGGSARARGLIEALLVRNDLAEAFTALGQLQADGMDMKQVHTELVEELRNIMIAGAGADEVLELSDDQLENVRRIAQNVGLGRVRRALAAIAPLSVPSGGPPLPIEVAFTGIHLDETAAAPVIPANAPVIPANAGTQAAASPPRTPQPPAPADAGTDAPVIPANAGTQAAASPPRTPQPPAPADAGTDAPVIPAPAPVIPANAPVIPANAGTQAAAPPPPPRIPQPPAPADAGTDAPVIPAPAPVIPANAPVIPANAGTQAAAPPPPPRIPQPPAPANADSPPPVPPAAGPPVPALDLAASGPVDLDTVRSRWKDIVNSLRGVGSSGNLDAYLRSVSEPIALDGDTLVIGFYHDFHKEKIEDVKYRRLVEMNFARVLGRPFEIRCERIERTTPAGHLVSAAIQRGATLVDTGTDTDADADAPT